MSLVAVDQVNHTVDANITVSLSSSDGGFDEGQQIQSVVRNCTNLTFNVFSPREDETLKSLLLTVHVEVLHFRQIM